MFKFQVLDWYYENLHFVQFLARMLFIVAVILAFYFLDGLASLISIIAIMFAYIEVARTVK